ncbi:MAG: LOW QUALITY PROTEIN: thiamine diphosphate-binding protein [Olpidium bornovanus]|uniref:Thiamine diphosphate-binding protein n=1 Tax=Olpidium bornovanus TaxID=278681 RepID=A0A8H7ZND8_9FUNG|nr:MAG: LOW QUALITY PROTEIN: thiamine diphosphate-binding protein [Olpidium bornovanus]
MAKKFAQVKRYGLEGAESMMVALDSLLRSANKAGVADVVLGMPHRGRLNLLTDLLQYDPTALFSKIKGNAEFPESLAASGDVLSHLASSPTLHYGQPKPLRVALLHNPSHLEAVNPVAMGKARAKQMYLFDKRTETDCHLGDRVMCVQLHGDAAFAGQGVVMESLGLSNLPHFTSGGSVHIIVNNQIGYTTPATNARSTAYTTDIAKMINAPIIHVNGDHPEDVAWASKLAFEYRNKFRKDVVLDLVSFRRWGHNELDEPSFTQPKMYTIIRSRKSVPLLYEERLLVSGNRFADSRQQLKGEGVIKGQAEIDNFRQAYFDLLDEKLKASDSYVPKASQLEGKWEKMTLATETISKANTGVDVPLLKAIGKASVAVPPQMSVHPRLEKAHIQSRLTKIASGNKIDWATGEALACGSLLLEGYGVRICGQDVGRGTFSQRHAMLVDQKNESIIVPLNNLAAQVGAESQGFLEVTNSNLSELAVLGFEYGMSIETPDVLNIWEAQFGDFFNSAQVIIDTYVASGESEFGWEWSFWLRQSGLVMLLPHGFDGAGPEHSSCRVERFLQMSDDRFDVANTSKKVNVNWHVVNPTTPAQYFHLLRRQMRRPFRKPLVVVAPKVLLRLPAAASDISEMGPGTGFQPVLGDSTIQDSSKSAELFHSRIFFFAARGGFGSTRFHFICFCNQGREGHFSFWKTVLRPCEGARGQGSQRARCAREAGGALPVPGGGRTGGDIQISYGARKKHKTAARTRLSCRGWNRYYPTRRRHIKAAQSRASKDTRGLFRLLALIPLRAEAQSKSGRAKLASGQHPRPHHGLQAEPF